MGNKKQILVIFSLIIFTIIPHSLIAQVMMSNNTFELDQEILFSINIDIPAGWRAFTRQDGTGTPVLFAEQTHDIRIVPSNSKAILTITVGISTPREQLSAEQFQRLISNKVLPLLPNAVEERAAIYQFAINGGYNAYCILTDASLVDKLPSPDEYKYVGIYFASYEDGCIVYGTLLTDDVQSEVFSLMLRSISSIEPSIGNK